MSRRRCRLWRYRGHASPVAVPGTRSDWAICHATADASAVGCSDCYDALIRCPDAGIRRAIATAEHTPVDVLEVLSTDADPLTSITARRRLSAHPPTSRRAARDPRPLPAPRS